MTMWTVFDASKPDPHIERTLGDFATTYARMRSLPHEDVDAIRDCAVADLAVYRAGGAAFLDKAISINVFEPNEFRGERENDTSMRELTQWLLTVPIEWRMRSDRFKALINDRFPSAGSPRIDVQGDTMILDALVRIAGKRVAVEYEVSKNMDNGITTLRMAVRKKSYADFGVMIVPLSPRRPGAANARAALNRIDQDFDSTLQEGNGAIYRIAIIRLLDVCERLAGGISVG